MTIRYVVKEQLASGGMGVVYRVHDRLTGEARALKRIQPDVAGEPFHVAAFEREYQVLAGLDHPRIIRVFDYGVDEIGPFYTMELLEGEDMQRAAPMPYRMACLYLRDVAASLALLHARRLIHRDLSPSNVRMTPDGHCKLLDFGVLAAFGSSRLVVGTPPAIPPEALQGAPLDQRADLYALGALAYWVLTERHAYPAKQIEELRDLWKELPAAPSALVEGIPKEVDALVMSLLSANPLARPASAAEVIARLNVVGELPEEGGGERERLAESFLLSPRFVGRAAHLEAIKERTDAVLRGRGSALLVEASAGMGRTRLLEEICVRAQIAGAGVVRVDASMNRRSRGTTRALVIRMMDAVPQSARGFASRYVATLRALGPDVEARLSASGSVPPPVVSTETEADTGGPLEGWFGEISRVRPLVVAVDNVDDADDASLGLIVSLAKLAEDSPILLIVTERVRRDPRSAAGLVTLRSQCTRFELDGLSPAETLELSRSLFGDAPNVERFAEWLHGRTAGSPLHCIEISRQLVARDVVRYMGGMWVLPVDRPDAELPAALEDALSIRLGLLTAPARALAESLSLQREDPTLDLCRQLVADGEPGESAEQDRGRKVHLLLDELARNDVLYVDQSGYRFSSVALREALLSGMQDAGRERCHRRLGEALARLAGPQDPALLLEAGWHLIKGGDDQRGAEMIAKVTHSSVSVRRLVANLHRAAEPIEAALKVYKRYRRSVYERMPLLAALSHVGYYEDRYWGDQYGDEALDACEDLSGVRTARVIARFLGRWAGIVLGVLFAYVRFLFTPKRERGYPFFEIFIQLFGAVTTITGTAALSLDVERATRVAKVLEIFSVLPRRFAAAGIYEFCLGLREIGREQQATACDMFDGLLKRFEDPRQFRALPPDARPLYITGAHFARGAFAVFREDGRAALQSADALDASGLKLYAMIASHLRFLYYANRGELALAAKHREQVELHAAHVGSAWQVEQWETAALIPLHTSLLDIVALTRAVDRLSLLCVTVPSLRLYAQMAELSLAVVRGDWNEEQLAAALGDRAPRSFIGWASVIGFHAMGCNERGQYAMAKATCESGLAHVTDADREYVSLFLMLDIQLAIADAGLGQVEEGLARIDGLLKRFRGSDHPLVQGFLHEARAHIAWMAGRTEEYDVSLAVVERWFRPTGTPALVARWERLAELKGPVASRRDLPPDSGSPLDPTVKTETNPLGTVTEPDARTVRIVLRKSESA
jgi:Protein kinase domain/AAA ATPase domain